MINTNLQYNGWHVGNTLKWLVENSKDKTMHSCARYVRLALIAGGISAYGNPINAQDYHYKGYLSSLGFKQIRTLDTIQEQEEFIPVDGDIAVMKSPTGNVGHICLWNGEQWVSDFKQKRMRPYSTKGTNPETVFIYRWDGSSQEC